MPKSPIIMLRKRILDTYHVLFPVAAVPAAKIAGSSRTGMRELHLHTCMSKHSVERDVFKD